MASPLALRRRAVRTGGWHSFEARLITHNHIASDEPFDAACRVEYHCKSDEDADTERWACSAVATFAGAPRSRPDPTAELPQELFLAAALAEASAR